MRTRSIISAYILAIVISCIGAAAQPVVKSNWAEFEGNKIRYYDLGNKKAKDALVFVHCWTCNVEFWKENYTKFPNYRVIAMDLPGHGQSDKPKVDYSMEFFARAVDAVMKKAGVNRAVLAGHSMGTPITRKYYELYPEKTLGLIVVDGALMPFGPRDQVEKFFEPMFKDYKAGATTFVDGMLQTVHAEVRPFVRSSMLATPDYVGASAMRLMLDDSYAPHGKINVPVLAVMAKTEFWPPDLEQKYKDVAPDLDFRMWMGVSHFLQLEKPAEFNAAVSEFISKKKLLQT
ncbi:MAG TPA: alpha/beta hydrolase [Pyrinomonadaceae bacterium]|nr:alpha/beta hydrolase [Pyrinomonadaceae bacterium]